MTHGSRREHGFTTFVAEYRLPLLRTALLLTGAQEQAEKLVGATLLKVYLRWDRFAEGGSPHLFAHETLVRRYVGRTRGADRRNRAALVLYRHEGMRPERISEVLGCAVETVLAACRRAGIPGGAGSVPRPAPYDLGVLLARGRRAQRYWDGARALGVLVLVVGCGLAAAGVAEAAVRGY